MNLADLIATLRSERLDDTVGPAYLYSDERITRALNEAVKQAAIRRRVIVDSQTAACCTVSASAGTELVSLHPRVLAVRSARWGSEDAPLELTTLRRLTTDEPDWPNATAGTPTHLVLDETANKVRLWPTPSAAGTLALSVWRVPLEAEELEADDDEPVIAEPFHSGLLDWAEHLLYVNKDGEAGDAARSSAAAQRFTDTFGPMPTAHAIRLWGLPRRGQRAQFI